MAACNVSVYYNASVVTALWLGSLTGSALQSTLHAHVSMSGVTSLPYTSSTTTDVWDALYVLDGDPKTGGHVIEIYTQRSVPANLSGSTDGWNREHLWPKSFGVGYSGFDFTDLHHIRAADWGVNSARSNKYFGECEPDNGADCVSPAHSEADNTTAATSLLFQPPKSVRGDIARALFYMAVRYDGEDSNTENLVLSKCPSADQYAMGNLTTLLQWHRDDPISAREMWRNQKVCELYQGNRNPFVDFPALAERVWQQGEEVVDPGCHAALPPSPPPTTASSSSDAPSSSSRPTSSLDDAEACLLLTGVVDGDRSGGMPKALELYANCDVWDMTAYGLGKATNGGASSGAEFYFSDGPSTLRTGDFVYVHYEPDSYAGAFAAFFGFEANYSSSVANVNGNDALELFWEDSLIDVFGRVGEDGDGTDWDYADGWAYRNNYTTGSSSWTPSKWRVRKGALADHVTNNDAGTDAVPVGKYRYASPTHAPTAGAVLTFSPTHDPTAISAASPTHAPTAGAISAASPTHDPTASAVLTLSPTQGSTLAPTQLSRSNFSAAIMFDVLGFLLLGVCCAGFTYAGKNLAKSRKWCCYGEPTSFSSTSSLASRRASKGAWGKVADSGEVELHPISSNLGSHEALSFSRYPDDADGVGESCVQNPVWDAASHRM